MQIYINFFTNNYLIKKQNNILIFYLIIQQIKSHLKYNFTQTNNLL